MIHEKLAGGLLHRAAGKDGLVLTHGAGGNCQMPLLVAIADAFASAGVSVLRYDLPFRQRRPHGPPPLNAGTADRAGLAEAVAAVQAVASGRIFVGGQSYGGRQASMLAGERPQLAQGLLLLSYPLHPPDKPDRMRTDHFPALTIPALFVHGTRDPFGSSEEFRAALNLIPAKTTLVEIEGAGHDLARGRFDIGETIVNPFLKLASE